MRWTYLAYLVALAFDIAVTIIIHRMMNLASRNGRQDFVHWLKPAYAARLCSIVYNVFALGLLWSGFGSTLDRIVETMVMYGLMLAGYVLGTIGVIRLYRCVRSMVITGSRGSGQLADNPGTWPPAPRA